MSISLRRRVLYSLTAASWLMVGHCVAHVLADDSRRSMLWLILAVMATIILSTASLFMAFIVPMDLVYKSAYEAGKASNGCSAYRPTLSSVMRPARPDNVLPIRQLHTEN